MNINYINKKPFVEGVCLNNITNSHSTPFYLNSQKKISETFENLKFNLCSEIFYAVKANSNQAILTLFKNMGAGADVVSVGELNRALKAKFKPDKIIFEGVGKSKEDIEFAIKKNIRLINTESKNEIKLINAISKNLNKKTNIGIRLNPNINSKSINKISTGKKTDKFGIPINELNEIILLTKNLKNINLIGISCHIGSQIMDIATFAKVFKTMKEAASLALSKKIPLKFLDLGGGFGISYKTNNDLNIKNIKKLLNTFFGDVPYSISFEPGRFLIAKSGVIITKILNSKKNGGVNYLITDAGMHTFMRPALYNANHRIEALQDMKKKKIKYTIAGPICESSDIISKNTFLPTQKEGNYLIIHDAGAYGSVMASNYNSRGLPSEILVSQNMYSIIYKREKISDIIKKDLIPKWI